MTSPEPAPAGVLEEWLVARRARVEAFLDARLAQPGPGDDPGRLIEAMRYSLLSAGKRLRPLIALAAAEACLSGPAAGSPASRPGSADADAGSDENLLAAATAVELIHCYSLIHDDLPAMDDDDFRRGRPSNHKVFGEATAILAGDALLTLAFEWLAEAGQRSGRADGFGRAALALARGAGRQGMVRGQARDLGEPPPPTLDGLEVLHAEKTAALFRAAAEVGAAASGAGPDAVAAYAAFGHHFGLAFQHADDLDDGDHAGHAASAREQVTAHVAAAHAALGREPPSRGGAVLLGLAEELRRRAVAS